MDINDFRTDMGQAEVRRQDALDLLRSLPDESVPLVVTDPPYGISYQSNRSQDGKSAPIAQDWNFQIGPFLDEVLRVLPEGGAAYVFTRWDVYPLWHKSIPKGLAIKNLIIWVKDNHSAGDLEGNFGFKHECIMMLTKGRHKRRGHRWSNVWDFSRVSHTASTHPAEKPVDLLQRIITASSDAGDLVVDPFGGSGATGAAAVELGRNVLLGDVDPKYVRLMCKRLGLPEPADSTEQVRATPSHERDASVCLEALNGLHPEDLEAVAAWLRERSQG